jgi:hypothetical protein
MKNPIRMIIYLVVSILSIATLIFYLFNTDLWDLWGYNFGFVVLIGSIIYTVYMTAHEMIKSDEPQIVASSEGLNVNVMSLTKNFFLDTYYKYLFCFSIAVNLFYMVHVLRNNFKIYEVTMSNWYYLADAYTNLILPLFLILDIFITQRYRHLHPVADLCVLFGISFLHCLYKVLIRSFYYDASNIVFPSIADYIIIFLFSVNGYILYDYLLYAKQNPVYDPADYNVYSS